MQNEMTVEASATLSYYAGCLRAARADVQRVEDRRADYPASEYSDVLARYRAALAVAEFDFKAEFQACQALEELAAMDAAPVAPVAVKAAQVRCNHYKAIRRCYAIARDAGLDISKAGKAKMRHCFETVTGQCVESRSEYSGAAWLAFGDAIKAGVARW